MDRGRSDPRNIFGIITDRDENDMCAMCVKAGILKGKLTRKKFDLCPQRLLTDADVNQTRSVTALLLIMNPTVVDRGMLGVTVLALRDASPIEANVCKNK